MNSFDNYTNFIQTLEVDGFVVWDHFLDESELQMLCDDYKMLHQKGRFKRAGIGKGSDHHLNDSIRKDETLWFEENDLTPAQTRFWNKLEGFKNAINAELFLGLWSLEGHYAFYSIGGNYEAHLDRFSNDDARTISMVFYLNENWVKGDGGELRIHRKDQAPLDIEPLGGRLVCFFSADVLHEVLPSNQPRKSFAGWWKRRIG